MSNKPDYALLNEVYERFITGGMMDQHSPFMKDLRFCENVLYAILDLNERLAKLEATQPKEENNV